LSVCGFFLADGLAQSNPQFLEIFGEWVQLGPLPFASKTFKKEKSFFFLLCITHI
jgi:hypothetical protein